MICVEYYPNPNCACVHVRAAVTTVSIATYERGKDLDRCYGQPPAPAWVRTLVETAGIVTVTLYPYQVNVHKAPLYSWDELLPFVVYVLETEFNDGRPFERLPDVRWTSSGSDGQCVRVTEAPTS